MPIGVPLSDLKRELRAETGQSLNVAQGVQAEQTYAIMLDRQQRELWDAYEWPHLRTHVDQPLAVGQSEYLYPSLPVAVTFDQVRRMYVAPSATSRWQELGYGIRSDEIPLGALPTGTPARWQNKLTKTALEEKYTTGFFILPVPDRAGMTLRMDGQLPCKALVDDEATCIIDSTAIVLFAAAEVLAAQRSETAALKLTKAQNYLRRLLQNVGGNKRTSFNMGGPQSRVNFLARRPYANAVPGIDYIP